MDRPLYVLVAVDLTPDGSVDIPDSPDVTAPVTDAPPCRLHPEHGVPALGCVCGFSAPLALRRRRTDRYTDRLGYRLRTVATIVLHGRLALEDHLIRAERATVAAIALPRDASAPRRERTAHAARRTGAVLVDLDPDRPDHTPLLQAAEALGAERADLAAFKRLRRDPAMERRRRADERSLLVVRLGLGLAGLVSIAIASALAALGAGSHITVAAVLVVWGLVLARLVPIVRNGSVELGGVAPPP